MRYRASLLNQISQKRESPPFLCAALVSKGGESQPLFCCRVKNRLITSHVPPFVWMKVPEPAQEKMCGNMKKEAGDVTGEVHTTAGRLRVRDRTRER